MGLSFAEMAARAASAPPKEGAATVDTASRTDVFLPSSGEPVTTTNESVASPTTSSATAPTHSAPTTTSTSQPFLTTTTTSNTSTSTTTVASTEAGAAAAAAASSPSPSNHSKRVSGSAPWLPSIPDPPTTGWGIEHVVLDASPLLAGASVDMLRAAHVWIPSAVAAEIRDASARQHFDHLQLVLGKERCHIVAPPAAALTRIRTFARQTGDLGVLSQPDLQVLALALALELAAHGEWRIRDRPGGQTGQQAYERARAAQAKQKQESEVQDKARGAAVPEEQEQRNSSDEQPTDPATTQSSSPAPQDVSPPSPGESTAATMKTEQTATPSEASTTQQQSEAASRTREDQPQAPVTAPIESAPQEPAAAATKPPAPRLAATSSESIQSPSSAAAHQRPTYVSPPIKPEGAEQHTSRPTPPHPVTALEAAQAAAAAEADEDSESEGGEWITASNLNEHKTVASGLVTERTRAEARAAASGQASSTTASVASSQKPKKPTTVACVSGDFAVQNVLLSLGIPLVSLGGDKITKVSSWMLRCHGCMKLCRDVTRKFCPVCGGATLRKVSVTATGKPSNHAGAGAVAGSAAAMGVKVHLKSNYQVNTRGQIYSLPMPKPGKASAGPTSGGTGRNQEPILREDQKEWQRAIHRDQFATSKAERKAQKAADEAARSGRTSTADTAFAPMDMGWGSMDFKSIYTGLPPIGMGRRNPNEKRRARK